LQLVTNVDCARLEVNVIPPQPERFGFSQAHTNSDREQGFEAAVAGGFEEGARLLLRERG
jgi:hypothetical protein